MYVSLTNASRLSYSRWHFTRSKHHSDNRACKKDTDNQLESKSLRNFLSAGNRNRQRKIQWFLVFIFSFRDTNPCSKICNNEANIVLTFLKVSRNFSGWSNSLKKTKLWTCIRRLRISKIPNFTILQKYCEPLVGPSTILHRRFETFSSFLYNLHTTSKMIYNFTNRLYNYFYKS